MKFKLIISKQANLFFFISNFAEWHFSCRLNYNEKWIKQTSPLNDKEKNILQILKTIFQKYNFNQYLGKFFINTDKVAKNWSDLKKNLLPDEYNNIKTAFKIFLPKFNKIWKANQQTLKINKKILENELKKPRILNIIQDLSVFFNYPKNKMVDLQIFLIISPVPMRVGGGANLQNNQITIECHLIQSETSYSERIIRTIFHEFSHILLKPLYLKYKELNQNHFYEAVIESLFPNGYLAKKYFHFGLSEKFNMDYFNKKPVTKNEIANFAAFKGCDIAKEYIENKRTMDENYIKTIKSFIE